MRSHFLGTHRRGHDVLPCFPSHGRPPKPLAEEMQGAVQAWVVGQPGRMPPLENFGAEEVRDEQNVGWGPHRGWMQSAVPRVLTPPPAR